MESRNLNYDDLNYDDQIVQLVEEHQELESVRLGRWYGSRYVNNGIYVVGNFEISRVSLEHVFSLPNLVLVDLRSGIEKKHIGSVKVLKIPPIKSKQINTIRLYGWPLSDKGVLDILKQCGSI